MRFFSMLGFHLRIFAQNSYFSQLMVTSTLSVLALQLLVAQGTPQAQGQPIWLRSALVGTWTVSTVAAGMIGFQRFQGTLVHLLNSPRSEASNLLPLIASASTFGLLTFPLAGLVSSLLGYPPRVVSWPLFLLGAFLFWLSALAISCLIAALFVLTPNAITYEGLLATPLILLSGIFGLPEGAPAWVQALSYLLPTSPAVELLLTEPAPDRALVLMLACLLGVTAWLALAYYATRRALDRVYVTGNLGVF